MLLVERRMYITKYVEQYGVKEGIAQKLKEKRLEFEYLDELSQSSPDCPWHFYHDMPVAEVVGNIFAPIAEKFSGTLQQLKENCKYLLCLRGDGAWYLLYVVWMYESDYVLWIGREPSKRVEVSETVRQAGWELPAPLEEFYRVHNGFGETDIVGGGECFDDHLWNAGSIRPGHRLELLEWKTRGEEQENYQPGEVLFCYHDGGGNYEGFLQPREEGEWLTVYYNHEEDYVEDSLAGDFFATMDEVFEETFM